MTNNNIEIISTSVQETIDLAKSIGQNLNGSEVFALIGQLGAGKTHFIKGLALGLEVEDMESVTSPTFTLINEYEGRYMLYHIDAWRLEEDSQLESLGFDEITCGPSVVVVEWADRVQALIDTYNPITITIEHKGETERLIKISNLPKHVNLI